jgi:hypothetical protein
MAEQVCRDRARPARSVEDAVNRLVGQDDGDRRYTRLTAEELHLLARAQEEGLAVIVERSHSDCRGRGPGNDSP